MKSKKKVVKKKNIIVVDTELDEIVKKRPAYRPTVYTMKHVILGERYLQECIDEEIQRVKTKGDTSTSWEYITKPKLPTIE